MFSRGLQIPWSVTDSEAMRGYAGTHGPFYANRAEQQETVPFLKSQAWGGKSYPVAPFFKMLFSKVVFLQWRGVNPRFPFSKASQAFPPA